MSSGILQSKPCSKRKKFFPFLNSKQLKFRIFFSFYGMEFCALPCKTNNLPCNNQRIAVEIREGNQSDPTKKIMQNVCWRRTWTWRGTGRNSSPNAQTVSLSAPSHCPRSECLRISRAIKLSSEETFHSPSGFGMEAETPTIRSGRH